MRRAPMKLMGDGSASLFTTTTGCRGTDAESLGNNSSVSQLCRKRKEFNFQKFI